MHLANLFRIAYSVVALAGAMMIGSCGDSIHPKRVHAQTEPDYALQTAVAVNSKLTDQLETDQTSLNARMDAFDMRENEMSTDISRMQGAGGAILVVLGVLNILGLIQARQIKKEAA